MMYQTYLNAIKQHITTGLTAVKQVDFYNEQYDNYDDSRPPKLPAVYVEFDNPMQWQTAGNGLQVAADTGIRLHLVLFDLSDRPDKLFALGKQLHQLMQGFEIVDNDGLKLSTAWQRTQSEVQKYDQLKTLVLTYQTALYDVTTLPQTTEVLIQPNINYS